MGVFREKSKTLVQTGEISLKEVSITFLVTTDLDVSCN